MKRALAVILCLGLAAQPGFEAAAAVKTGPQPPPALPGSVVDPPTATAAPVSKAATTASPTLDQAAAGFSDQRMPAERKLSGLFDKALKGARDAAGMAGMVGMGAMLMGAGIAGYGAAAVPYSEPAATAYYHSRFGARDSPEVEHAKYQQYVRAHEIRRVELRSAGGRAFMGGSMSLAVWAGLGGLLAKRRRRQTMEANARGLPMLKSLARDARAAVEAGKSTPEVMIALREAEKKVGRFADLRQDEMDPYEVARNLEEAKAELNKVSDMVGEAERAHAFLASLIEDADLPGQLRKAAEMLDESRRFAGPNAQPSAVNLEASARLALVAEDVKILEADLQAPHGDWNELDLRKKDIERIIAKIFEISSLDVVRGRAAAKAVKDAEAIVEKARAEGFKGSAIEARFALEDGAYNKALALAAQAKIPAEAFLEQVRGRRL